MMKVEDRHIGVRVAVEVGGEGEEEEEVNDSTTLMTVVQHHP